MQLSEFKYNLPKELIAQEPIAKRDTSSLLIVDRKQQSLKQEVFKDITRYIRKGDIVVLNDTRVLAARLLARRKSGAQLEVLLLKEIQPQTWEVLVKPGKRAHLGDNLIFGDGSISAAVLDRTPAGGRLIKFNSPSVKKLINKYGQMPLPHYIKKELKIPGRYQTIYAKHEGAVAAPTAGFHFTRSVLGKLSLKGARVVYVTLHCGLATFRPVKTTDIRNHPMESEAYEISPQAARAINQAKVEGRRVIAVGTTVVRVLESAAFNNQKGVYQIKPQQTQTRLYIYPGYSFKIVDAFLTNFHLPDSTNLILVSAFAGMQFVRRAYQYAIDKRFRFYSFGDAMLVV
ncbi:tRNA preQ1(34) S-adenosylmethionine ribosyltransferase-isomerase QueA [Candidatus Omnitrophota bacterium]